MDCSGGDAGCPSGIKRAREESKGEAGSVKGLGEVLARQLISGKIEEGLECGQLQLYLQGGAAANSGAVVISVAAGVGVDTFECPFRELVKLSTSFGLKEVITVAFLEALVQPGKGKGREGNERKSV